MVPAGLVGVQDYETLVGGQDELVAALQDRVARREDVVAPMVVPLDVLGRLDQSVGLTREARGGRVAVERVRWRHLVAASKVAGQLLLLLLLLHRLVPLLGGQQLLEVLGLLDEAVETAGQVHALAPGYVHVLVLDNSMTQFRGLVGDVLDQVGGAVDEILVRFGCFRKRLS